MYSSNARIKREGGKQREACICTKEDEDTERRWEFRGKERIRKWEYRKKV
jgi:hypothetical protein